MGKGRDKRRRSGKGKKIRESVLAPVPAFANARGLPPGEPPSTADPFAFAGAPLKTPPHLNSGAIALPEPAEDAEPYLDASARAASRVNCSFTMESAGAAQVFIPAAR